MPRFKSRIDGLMQRNPSWVCPCCTGLLSGKGAVCNHCEKSAVHFASNAELKRYRELLWLLKVGKIETLILQPRFELVINGHNLGFHKADFKYLDVRLNEHIYEDVKSRGSNDAYSRLKRELVYAIHGIKIEEIYT